MEGDRVPLYARYKEDVDKLAIFSCKDKCIGPFRIIQTAQKEGRGEEDEERREKVLFMGRSSEYT